MQDDPIAMVREMLEIGWDLHRMSIECRVLTAADVAQETELHKLEEAFVRLQIVLADVGAARRREGLERFRFIVAKVSRRWRQPEDRPTAFGSGRFRPLA